MMTKKKTRLGLNKETIANLHLAMMAQVVGGTGPTTGPTDTQQDCPPKDPTNYQCL